METDGAFHLVLAAGEVRPMEARVGIALARGGNPRVAAVVIVANNRSFY